MAAVAGAQGSQATEWTEWRLKARCRGASADQFYPPDKEGRSARLQRELQAKAVCHSCPVLEPCRRYAVETQEPHGVWGATTPRDRERLLDDARQLGA